MAHVGHNLFQAPQSNECCTVSEVFNYCPHIVHIRCSKASSSRSGGSSSGFEELIDGSKQRHPSPLSSEDLNYQHAFYNLSGELAKEL